MFLTKAKSANSCDMGVGLVLPVDAPFHIVVDVILLEIPDVCAQHCIVWLDKNIYCLSLMSAPNDSM